MLSCYSSTPIFAANNHTLTYPPCMWKRLSRTRIGLCFHFIFGYVDLVVCGSENSCWRGAIFSFLPVDFRFPIMSTQ